MDYRSNYLLNYRIQCNVSICSKTSIWLNKDRASILAPYLLVHNYHEIRA